MYRFKLILHIKPTHLAPVNKYKQKQKIYKPGLVKGVLENPFKWSQFLELLHSDSMDMSQKSMVY